jgi:hypothetical protein
LHQSRGYLGEAVSNSADDEDIYGRAASVLLWLGETTPYDDMTLTSLVDIYDDPEVRKRIREYDNWQINLGLSDLVCAAYSGTAAGQKSTQRPGDSLTKDRASFIADMDQYPRVPGSGNAAFITVCGIDWFKRIWIMTRGKSLSQCMI